MARALIIDDDKAVRDFFRTVLEKLCGLEVAEADTVAAGLKCLSAGLPDILLLDSNLPDGTARDFCFQLKKNAPQALALPKLIISGVRRLERDNFDWQACGVKGYLVKPCSIDELKEAVTKCLEN
ncbi:MAG: response regulator [Elusimicrobiaceae bacterium]|nr:response regulator [Elusimicrobiaceae bacterium]